VTDRLSDLLVRAAAGAAPPVDFATEVIPRPAGPVSAVLGFTGHHVVAADVDSSWVDATRDLADFGSVLRAPFLAALGAHLDARVGHLDVVLVRRTEARPDTEPANPELELVEVPVATDAHARVRRALAYRREVRVFRTRDGAGTLMIGRGLANRWEIAFEVEQAARGRGLGTALAAAGPGLTPSELLFAQVSPGNVASLRVLLAAGYRPIGSEVLLLHPGPG
jgi:hypothetical protein